MAGNPFSFVTESLTLSKFEKHSERVLQLLDDYKKSGNSPLHRYQILAVQKTEALILKDKSQRRLNAHSNVKSTPEPVLIVAPTGAGKSEMIALLPYVLASKKVLILTPSHVISNQLAAAFGYEKGKKCFFETCGLIKEDDSDRKEVLEGLLEDVRVIQSPEDIKRNIGRLVIVNAQKFGGKSRLSLVYQNEVIIADVKAFFAQFDTLIVDEAHYYPAKTWSKIIEEFGKPVPKLEKKIIFLTATPNKNIRGKEEFILGPEPSKKNRIAFEVDAKMITDKAIRRCEFVEMLHHPHEQNGEFETVYDDLEHLLKRNSDWETRFVPQAMILVRLRKEAETLVKVLNRKSGRDNFAVAFVGDKKKGAVADALQRFTNGEFQVGVTCGIAKDGYDNSRVTVCVILRRIVKGTILFNQFVGRCMRIRMGLGGLIPVQSRGTVLSYVEYEQKQLWEGREKWVADEDPVEVDFEEGEQEGQNEMEEQEVKEVKRGGRKRRRAN